MRFATAAALALLALPAVAADGVTPAIFAAKLFGKVSTADITNICLNRVYDAAHMVQHPQQKVTSMIVEIANVPETKDAAATISFSIGVRLRGSRALFTSGGNCSLVNASGLDNGLVDHLQCSVDCDGGGISFRLPVDATSVFTELEKGEQLSLSRGNDMEHGISLVRGADDRLFKLDRTNIHACLPIVGNDDVKASIKRTR